MTMPEFQAETTVQIEQEQGRQIAPCPLGDFSELWLKVDGCKVIDNSLVKALIVRKDGQKINPENFRVMIRGTMKTLKEQGVLPKDKKLWDVEFVRHFCCQVQENKRKVYQIAEIDNNVLERLRGLKIEVKPVRSPSQAERITNLRLDSEPGQEDIQGLIEFGRRQGYVSLDDILNFFPETEQNVEQLEEVFSELLSAGIAFTENLPTGGPSEDELVMVEAEEPKEIEFSSDDYLANIDVNDTIGLYLKEVSRVPLLTADQEVELAQRIERGLMAREELAKGKISSGRRMELRKIIEDGWQAREHLITANARLVISVAKKYMNRGVQFLDLIQEGNIGLIRATKKFDYRRGHKFSTYATWWIRQAVTRAIADQGRTIRVPVHMSDKINKMLRVQHQLTQKLGRDPSVEELANTLEVAPKNVENMIQVARRPLSLETPTDDEEQSVLGDFIEDSKAVPPDDTATYNLLREKISEVLNDLPPREVRILQLRYGLLDGQKRTLEEVGQKMGVTRERVRQLETQALIRLRHRSIKSKLRDYLGD